MRSITHRPRKTRQGLVSSSPSRRTAWLLACALLLLAAAPWRSRSHAQTPEAAAASAPAGEQAQNQPVLQLANRGRMPGLPVPSDRPGVLSWKSDAFTKPLSFELPMVSSAVFPSPAVLPKPDGDYCFELLGGDVIFGSLVSLDEKNAEVEAPRMGRIEIARGSICRMYRWKSSKDLVYLGPNGLAGWSEKGWKEDQGQPWTDQDGAAIRGNFHLPSRAIVEFEVSWEKKPDFVFALGVNDDEKTAQKAFRFEVWERDLVVQRETEKEADVASVGEIAQGAGRIHLIAYLDQDSGRIIVTSADGKSIADLKVSSGKENSLEGLSLLNKRGDLRLERLRISRWDGEAPKEIEADKSRVHRADGSIAYGQLSRFDAKTREFILGAGADETRIPEDQVAGVFLSLPTDAKGRAMTAVYHDGTRLSGSLDRVEADRLTMTVPGIAEPLRLPIDGLRALVSLNPLKTLPPVGDVPGVLELSQLRLPGRLVDAKAASGESCLAWQPQGSQDASPLRPGVSGRIIYREPPPPKPQAARQQANAQPAGPGGFVVGFLSALGGSQTAQPVRTGKKKSIYLRTGDIIPSEITGIDENGVSFKTPLSSSSFVANEKVKAVELIPQPDVPLKLSKLKRERLLTLPRMQKGSPPTHLIQSRSGDYLRGRLVKLDDKALEVELRLDSKTVPRDRVGLIIWLHPEEKEAAKPQEPKEGGESLLVQAVCSDGIRLTYRADQFTGNALAGVSDVLGACQVHVKDIDQILIGSGIEQAAAQLAYQQWKLQDAPEIKVAQADANGSAGGSSAGTESPLVGKPAPDFTLELLDGKKFHLAEQKGKIILLDFWATWCGPCLNAMPQVEEVAKEFQDRDVQLIAVNLQEDAKQITAMLERHNLHPAVALDRDGVVAERYAANAIPQTVIIDKEGKLVRLFVGGGPHLGDQLRQSLSAVIDPAAAPPASAEKPAAENDRQETGKK